MSSIENDDNNNDNKPKQYNQQIKDTLYNTFNGYINELLKQLYSTIAFELIKITQNDLASEIKTILSSNQVKDALQNEISGLIDKYTSKAVTLRNNCLNEINQHITLINQYCQLKLNNSLDESKSIFNALSNSVEKLIRETKDNMKGVVFNLKSLSTYTSNISDYIKKQKPCNALEKIQLSEKRQSELSNKINDIKGTHEMFYNETKRIFKQLKDIFEEKRQFNKSKSPIRSQYNLKGKTKERKQTASLSPPTSLYSNYIANDNRTLNKTTLAKEINANTEQYTTSSNYKVMKTKSSNNSFNYNSLSNSNKAKSPIARIDHRAVNESIHQLKQQIRNINKKNTELTLILSKERTEKAFLLKEITKLNTDIDKYKDYGLSVNNTVNDIIKGNNFQKIISMKEYNNQMIKLIKISEMTIAFANSLSVLQDSLIKKSSTSIELKMLYDSLKRTLAQIVNDISGISKYITNQYGLNIQGNQVKDNQSDTININKNYKRQNEEIEELQNEIFELKTQIALMNSKHIEEISTIQNEMNDNSTVNNCNNDYRPLIKHQHTFPSSSSSSNMIQKRNSHDDDNEINQLKKELKRKLASENLLIKEIKLLKENANTKKESESEVLNINKDNSQNAFEMIKQKHNQNIEQLKRIYEESIDAKEKSINYLNDTNNQLQLQVEKLASDKTSLEATLSSNLIQYEIELSNIQNEKMRIEIQLEESSSNALINEQKLIYLTEALNAKETNNAKVNQNEEYIVPSNRTLHSLENDALSQRPQDDDSKLNQKIVELTSVIESKDLIEQSINESLNCLKERIIILESKENQQEQKIKEITESYSKEKEKTDSLIIDKMILMQKNDDLNIELKKYLQKEYITPIGLIEQLPKTYHIISIMSFSFISKGTSTVAINKSDWNQINIIKQISQIKYCKDDTADTTLKAEKQLVNIQKEELILLKNKLKTSLDQNKALIQKLNEVESNFNSEKGEYIGMLRVAFEKLISEIQITNKAKEFTTVIMRMLNYSDGDIFDIYNSGKKKTLFGFLK